LAGGAVIELAFCKPNAAAVFRGFLPSDVVTTDGDALFISIGILGATVMPHNLYLHSSIVQTRKCDHTLAGVRQAIRYFTVDSSVALALALFVNAAILIVAAATFYTSGNTDVQLLEDGASSIHPSMQSSLLP
jgi:manganese transport protein